MKDPPKTGARPVVGLESRAMMETLFYDDDLEARPILPRSIFLAGPTARGIARTPWRAAALEWLEERAFPGSVLLPEFREALFADAAPQRFSMPPSGVPGMRTISCNVLRWETAGIERSTVVLFWMPFRISDEADPASLPGFTTRAEVSRELARDPSRVALGMPSDAFSSSHIRFHAHRVGVTIAGTLHETLEVACRLAATGGT